MKYYKLNVYLNIPKKVRKKMLKSNIYEGRIYFIRAVERFKSFKYFMENYKYINFNIYDNSRVTLRIELEEDINKVDMFNRLEYIGKQMKKVGSITKYDVPLSEEILPEEVKMGHQLASDIVEYIYDDDYLLNELYANQLNFFIFLANMLFKNLGYKYKLSWDESREYLQGDENRKDKLEYKINDILYDCDLDIYKGYKNNPDFLERTLHLMLNILGLQYPCGTSFFGHMTPEGLFWELFNRAKTLQEITKK